MRLEAALPEHSAELVAFFKRFRIDGPVELRIDRGRDFFRPYEIQSDSHITYCLRSKNEELLGVASFVIGESIVGGQQQRVAFGRDLRILETREAVLGWSKHFLPVMEEIQKVFQVDTFASALNLNEVKAMNAFIRPRPGKRPLPRYYLYRRFNLVSLHGQFPWCKDPVPSIRVRHATEAMADALIYYIVQKTRERDLSMHLTADAFTEALKRWTGLTLENFLVAQDAAGNIIGCCAPWNPGNVQDYIPLHYHLQGHNFRQFLKFGRMFGWTRPLTKPLSRSGQEEGLDFKYLCFLFAENADIFESLARTAYDEARPTEFLTYTQMRSDLHLRRPLTWVSAKIPYGMYVLVPPSAPFPTFLHPGNLRPACIEPFFV